MEKLIELLNEYEIFKCDKKPRGLDSEGELFCYGLYGSETFYGELICGKPYGFIQRLVENEKIEYRKIIEKEIEVGFKLVRIKDYPNKIMEEDVEELLMLLSIQDNPIKFLISILK